MQNLWLKQGCGAIRLALGAILKQGCGAIRLDLNKGVVQYFWLKQLLGHKQGCGAIHLDLNKVWCNTLGFGLKQGRGAKPLQTLLDCNKGV